MTTLSDHFRYKTLLDRLSDPDDYCYDAELQKWIKNDKHINENSADSLFNKIKCITMSVITVIAVVLLCIKLSQYKNDEMIVFDRRNLMMAGPNDSNPQTPDEQIKFIHKYVLFNGYMFQHYIKLTSIPHSMSKFVLIQWNDRKTTDLTYHSIDLPTEGIRKTLITNYIEMEFLKTGRLVRNCTRQNHQHKSCINTFNCNTKHWDDWSCNFIPSEQTVRTVHYWDSWNFRPDDTYHNQAWYPRTKMYEPLEPYNTYDSEANEEKVYQQLVNTMAEKVKSLNKTSCVKNTKAGAPYALCKNAVVPGAVAGVAGFIVGGILGLICETSAFMVWASVGAAWSAGTVGGALHCDHKHYGSVVCQINTVEISPKTEPLNSLNQPLINPQQKDEVKTNTTTQRQNPPKIRNY